VHQKEDVELRKPVTSGCLEKADSEDLQVVGDMVFTGFGDGAEKFLQRRLERNVTTASASIERGRRYRRASR